MYKYNNAYKLISDFLENKKCYKHWRSPKIFISIMNWKLYEYSKKVYETKHFTEYLTTDAYSYYKNGMFFILLCKECTPKRKTFNLHHEVGHIIAGHSIINNSIYGHYNNIKNTPFEIEATIIGRNIFFNAKIFKNLQNYIKNDKLFKRYLNKLYQFSYDYINARLDYIDIDIENINFPSWVDEDCSNEIELFEEWYRMEYNAEFNGFYL